MIHSDKGKIILLFGICLFFGASEVFACVCMMPGKDLAREVKFAAKNSTTIFTGKVVGFEYRKGIRNKYMESRIKSIGKNIEYETLVIKFQVDRRWKGEATKEIFLVTDQTKNSDGTQSSTSCDIYFKIGENYLIYGYGKIDELRTSPCSRTNLLEKTKDLEILGKGKSPKQNKSE